MVTGGLAAVLMHCDSRCHDAVLPKSLRSPIRGHSVVATSPCASLLLQIAACVDSLADVLAKRLLAGTPIKAMRLAYLAALAAPWAAACRQLPPRTR